MLLTVYCLFIKKIRRGRLCSSMGAPVPWHNGTMASPSLRSTTHTLVDMTHHWLNAVDKGQSARTVFVDFAKTAFDTVRQANLFTKISLLNIPTVYNRRVDFFGSHTLYEIQRICFRFSAHNCQHHTGVRCRPSLLRHKRLRLIKGGPW